MAVMSRFLFVAPVVAGLLLGACSGSDDDDGGDEPTSAQAEATTATPAGSGSPDGGSTPGESTPGATVPATPQQSADPNAVSISFEPVLSGLQRPTGAAVAPGDDRLFVLEKQGRIRTVRDGVLDPEPFLDITSLVNSQGNEQGLLGLAFHPDFAENGRFFVYYTAKTAGAGDNTVAEFAVTDDPDLADAGSEKVLLAIEDFAANHNGGQLAFGPDGYLYIGTGDGGSGGDPRGNGQNRNTLLGKILRIDVDNIPSGEPYGIPDDNPFAAAGEARGEIWAYGLRNPWRFSFDRETGDLYIADVGQNKFEEVNFQPADSKGGENYGWNVVEGPECYSDSNCAKDDFVAPVAWYGHAQGCSVTGGYVYRGSAQPALQGLYVYADYCSGRLWVMPAGGGESVNVATANIRITSFAEDAEGELYAFSDQDGGMFRVVATAK